MDEEPRVDGDLTGELQPGFHNCHFFSHQMHGFSITSDPYATLGQQLRAELDREAEAVAYLEARGYKVIKVDAS